MPVRARAQHERRGPFATTLFRYSGKGAWHFAIIPADIAPPATRPWGRTPVTATVDGVTWETSIWRDTRSGRSLLAVPKKHRAGKGDGDSVTVTFVFEPDDD
ncbi:MAG: DUF1905 domain-containing protein [Acidobacteria bacterium]|nr:DUF1905 domain-containing protein [Acidobacteriota bacterium]